ncbi:exosporium protein C [Paenibacillus donghaensis]|uniref:exosporium protein C n=1 Tax=Paenibacillus donghaensis TaxID=414771 RepID=UPI001883FB44|nr:exosporium protein C [Paenibacillus donghaensis]MBE9913732.1 exosporium protein C [Paenibacillus donghaensis]
MPQSLTGFGGIAPITFTNGISSPIPLVPKGVGIIDATVTVAPMTQVWLNATVGVQGNSGTGRVLFRIFRFDQEIFYTVQGIETNFEKFYTVSFSTLDTPPEGETTYTLAVEALTQDFSATVVGPLTFTAAAITFS